MARPKKITSVVAIDDKEELLQKIATLQKKLEEMEKSSNKVENSFQDDDNFEKIKINQDDYIKVMSLCPHTLNLSTKGNGKGDIFTFDQFGEVKRILYSDLVKIIENHKNFLNSGRFFICDKNVVRRHGLDETYQHILSKENIEKIIDGDKKEAVELFKMANSNQQKIIVDFLITKVANGEEIDMNTVSQIATISGVKIAEKATEAKEYSEIFNQK